MITTVLIFFTVNIVLLFAPCKQNNSYFYINIKIKESETEINKKISLLSLQKL